MVILLRGLFLCPEVLSFLSSLVDFFCGNPAIRYRLSSPKPPLFCAFQLPSRSTLLAITAGLHRPRDSVTNIVIGFAKDIALRRIRECPTPAFLCRGRQSVPPINNLLYRPVPSIILICAFLPCSIVGWFSGFAC